LTGADAVDGKTRIASLTQRANAIASPLGSVLVTLLMQTRQPEAAVLAVVARMIHGAERANRRVRILAKQLQECGWLPENVADIVLKIEGMLADPRPIATELLPYQRALERLGQTDDPLTDEIRQAVGSRSLPLRRWLERTVRAEGPRSGERMKNWHMKFGYSGDSDDRQMVRCLDVVADGLAVHDFDASLQACIAARFRELEEIKRRGATHLFNPPIASRWSYLVERADVEERELRRNLETPVSQVEGGLHERMGRMRLLVETIKEFRRITELEPV
jgi:hypothetical protein